MMMIMAWALQSDHPSLSLDSTPQKPCDLVNYLISVNHSFLLCKTARISVHAIQGSYDGGLVFFIESTENNL